LVFTTKYRRGTLTDPILTRRQQIMASVRADFGAQLREFNGEDDHIHLLVHHPPTVALSKLINSLKGGSARRLRQEYGPHPRRYLRGAHLWSPSYLAGSCNGAPLAVVKKYIENQKRPGP
jgi:putative transposase